MMPMLLDAADRKLLTERVLARLQREKPAGCATNEDLRLAIEIETAALITEGQFVIRDGTLLRRPPSGCGCHNGWISVPDPVLGGLIDSRCPTCSP